MRNNGWKAVVPKCVCLILVAAVTFLGVSVDSAEANHTWHSADGNANDEIDGLDYLIWALAFSAGGGDVFPPALDPPGHPYNADYHLNGVIDGGDYLTWASSYGELRFPPDPPGDSTTVPEPSTMALGLIAAVGMFLSPRRRRMS